MNTIYHRMLVILLVGAMCSSAGIVNAADTAETSLPMFEAQHLWKTYPEDQNLVGKTVQVSGVVVETGMSIYMTPTVRLSDKAGGDSYVICVLPRKDTGLLSSFTVGEQVTMRGRVYSRSSSGIIVVKESQRVES